MISPDAVGKHRPLDPRLPVRDRALAAVARTRATGMHFYGHFLGLHADGAEERGLVIDPPTALDCPDAGRAGSPGELSCLADLAIGSALRRTLGAGLRLGTTSMKIHHLAEPVPGRLTSHPETFSLDATATEGYGRCTVTDADGNVVLAADAWFLVLPPPTGRPMPGMPWESDEPVDVPTLRVEDLEPAERAALATVEQLESEAHERNRSVAALLTLPSDFAADRDGVLRGCLPLGHTLVNRVGQVQGGALYGVAAEAAAAVMGPGWALIDGYTQFLRPAEGEEMLVEAKALRRGRRASFTDVSLSVQQKTVVTARFTHRPLAA